MDPRTVQSRIQKAEGERDRDHWEAVSRQVDVRYLEEHLNMLVRVSIDLQQAVRTSPFESNWEQPIRWVAALVAVGLKRPGGVLESRGVDLRPPGTSTTNDVVGKPPGERLAGKLLNGLTKHEPALKASLDQWSSHWLKIQEERRDLQGQAISLFGHQQIGEEIRESVANSLGPVAAGQAIASALSLPGEGGLTAEAGDDGLTTLMLTGGKQVCVVQKAEAGQVCRAYERVREQMLHEERIRPLQEAYRSLTESLAKIEDLVDHILLRGKPRGTCFLCPEDSGL